MDKDIAQQLFKKYDKNGDRYISLAESKELAHDFLQYLHSQHQLEDIEEDKKHINKFIEIIFTTVDVNDDLMLGLNEFRNIFKRLKYITRLYQMNDEQLHIIENAKLTQLVEGNISEENVRNIFKKYDLDDSDRLGEEELEQFFYDYKSVDHSGLIPETERVRLSKEYVRAFLQFSDEKDSMTVEEVMNCLKHMDSVVKFINKAKEK